MTLSPPAIEPIPAVDLSGGRVVRLLRGVRDQETIYGEDPVGVASAFAADGARWLHVVDLDAAFGDSGNRDAVRRLLAASPLAVQVAGGVRSVRTYGELRDLGAARVVFGTLAVEEPEVVEAVIRMDPAGVAVALDVRAGRLQTRGWVEPIGEAVEMATETVNGGAGSVELAARYWGERGASSIVYTSVERDGTLEGPDVEAALRVASASGLPTVLAGGVGTLAHLEAVRAAGRGPRSETGGPPGRPQLPGRLAGVILGRALYEKRFTLAEARTVLTGTVEPPGPDSPPPGSPSPESGGSPRQPPDPG